MARVRQAATTGLRFLALMLGSACANAGGEQQAAQPARVTIDDIGQVHVPAMVVPLSSLTSDEAKRNFLDAVRGWTTVLEGDDIIAVRKRIDERLMRPGVEKLRAVFPVVISPKRIAGVQADVIEPTGGVATKNKNRVLINLHGAVS